MTTCDLTTGTSDRDARRAELARFATGLDRKRRYQRRYIVDVLASLEWNISRAAIVLGVERTNLHKKIRAYGIKRGETPA